jgi:2-desacetyl-2-hydroxyethyl bacteriochlorophyllide A dehydrogenase
MGSSLAVQFVAARDARVIETEVHEGDLGPHEVVVEAKWSVISPGTELAHFTGSAETGPMVHTRAGFPWAPGYAMCGVVRACGDATGVRPGQRVLAHVPHARVVRFDVRKRMCLPVPEAVPDNLVPFARLAQVSGVILQAANFRPGDVVAVLGLGVIGNFAAQLAGISGATVVGIDPSESRRATASACGVAMVADLPEAEAVVRELDGADVVVECSGRAAAAGFAADLCAKDGEIFLIGAPWRHEPQLAASDLLAKVFEKYLSVRSGWEWQIPRTGGRHSIAGCTEWIFGLLDRQLVTDPLITEVITPGDLPAAYERLDREPGKCLTFLIDWNSANSTAKAAAQDD